MTEANDIQARRRQHEANHIRTIEVQTLDALLRIDESLMSILEGMRHLAKQLPKPEVTKDEPETVTAPKGKRK